MCGKSWSEFLRKTQDEMDMNFQLRKQPFQAGERQVKGASIWRNGPDNPRRELFL